MPKEYDVYWNSYLPIFFDRMNSCMRQHMTDIVKDYGLTSAHAVYLIALTLKPGMTQKEISVFLDLDVGNTTRVLKVLREKGMAYDDRKSPESRNYKVYLTEIGKKLGNEVMDSTMEWMDGIMSDIPKDDILQMRNTLLKILNKMDPNLDKYMQSEWTNPFYTYLHANPEGEDSTLFASILPKEEKETKTKKRKGR
jgi:DNA-binding MarR family transcriptional regulator